MEGEASLVKLKYIINFFVRKKHPANSLFINSRSLSPGTSNLIAMRQSKIDRTAYSKENLQNPFVKNSEICHTKGDPEEISHRFFF